MSQTNTPHKYQQRPVEDILDFCTLLGSRMIASGANLERVKLQMNRLQSLNSLCYSIAKHTPSPKDLFFYALLGVYNHNPEMVRTNGINCALTLAGMSIGFVLSFVAAHYIRGWRLTSSRSHVPGGHHQ